MVSIPDELIEAARLDGAGEFTIFRRIVFPLSWPVIAVRIYLYLNVEAERLRMAVGGVPRGVGVYGSHGTEPDEGAVLHGLDRPDEYIPSLIIPMMLGFIFLPTLFHPGHCQHRIEVKARPIRFGSTGEGGYCHRQTKQI